MGIRSSRCQRPSILKSPARSCNKTPHDAAQGGVRFQRCRIDADRLPLDQSRVGQLLQNPREDRRVRLQIDQSPRQRDRRVVRRGVGQLQMQKRTHAQRVSGAPRDRALRIQALKVPEQQQPDIPPWRQAGAPQDRRVELRALRFDERVALSCGHRNI